MLKKLLLGSLTFLVLAAIVLVVFKNPILESLKDVITADTFVQEDTDDFDPGLASGSTFPLIDAQYKGEKISSISPLSASASKGSIFVVSRSIVWCPYCMKQMIQLSENLEAFESQGWSVIGLTYDSEAQQQAFSQKYMLNYPLLSDNNAASVISLGVLNERYSEGDEAYGIGHPGAFIVNNSGVIIGKVFLRSYAKRVDAAALLDIANQYYENHKQFL